MIIRSIIILIALKASAFAEARDVVTKLQSELSVQEANPQELRSIWSNLRKAKFKGCTNSLWTRDGGQIGNWLDQTFESLLAQSAISLSPKGELSVEVDRAPDMNTSFRAFYLPGSHHIFLSTGLDRQSHALSLLHEVIHAFQYTYRLPLDLAELQKLVNKNIINREMVLPYLHYFYEAQAHWYVMRTCPRQEWAPEPASFLVNTVNVTKMLVNLASFGSAGAISNAISTNPWLPEVDQLSSASAYCKSDALTCFTHYREHIAFSRNHIPLTGFGSNESRSFRRMQDFSTSVERAYFGADGIYGLPDGSDQKNLLRLHNRFYKTLLTADLEELRACRDLWQTILTHVPLQFWLSADAEHVCAIYKPAIQSGSMNFMRSLLAERADSPSTAPKSLFVLKGGEGVSPDGGEGVSPDLDLLQPQLDLPQPPAQNGGPQ